MSTFNKGASMRLLVSSTARQVVLLGILCFGVCSFVFGQAAEKPLSNDDVIKLVEAKLGKDVVISKVNQATSVALDVSTEALISLKKRGVPDDVINAMVKRQEKEKPKQAAATPTASPTKQPPAEESRMSRMKARMMSAVKRDKEQTDVSKSVEPESKPEDVKLYLTDAPKEPYKELGRVDSGKYNFAGISRNRDAINAELKQKAAKLGASAVINITEDFASVSGAAVKFEKKQ